MVGPAAFAIAAIVGGFVADDYSPVHDFVSELAATGSDAHVLMTIGFLTFGVSIFAIAIALRRLRPAALALALVVALSGAGTLMAGTFSCDKGCPVDGVITTHQKLHNVSSVLTFSAWIIAPFIAARQLRGSRFARISLVLGVVELAIGLLLGANVNPGPDDPVGLLQRIVLLAVGLWFVLLALDLRRTSEVA